jgi:hypothetical protein
MPDDKTGARWFLLNLILMEVVVLAFNAALIPFNAAGQDPGSDISGLFIGGLLLLGVGMLPGTVIYLVIVKRTRITRRRTALLWSPLAGIGNWFVLVGNPLSLNALLFGLCLPAIYGLIVRLPRVNRDSRSNTSEA